MGFFDFLKSPDINEGIVQYTAFDGDKSLVDVREQDEYTAGHIPGSVNLPLSQIAKASQVLPNKSTALYVYCLSGARSAQATAQLKQMGYHSVTNIGGIGNYTGKVEK